MFGTVVQRDGEGCQVERRPRWFIRVSPEEDVFGGRGGGGWVRECNVGMEGPVAHAYLLRDEL